MTVIDISVPIQPDMIAYEGDPGVEITPFASPRERPPTSRGSPWALIPAPTSMRRLTSCPVAPPSTASRGTRCSVARWWRRRPTSP
jgi:hypothetical protein